jgi:hypothetical protein
MRPGSDLLFAADLRECRPAFATGPCIPIGVPGAIAGHWDAAVVLLVVASDASQQCGDVCDLGGIFAIYGNQVTTQLAQGHK